MMVPADFESLDYERMTKLESMVATGTDKPENLTSEENLFWDGAVQSQQRARDRGLIVEIPGETPGGLVDD